MLMKEATECLKELGIRITPQRQGILRVLVDHSQGQRQPLSADEILLKVREHYPTISQDTVYRTLATFEKSGLVNEVHFRDKCRRFEFVQDGMHHHHVVCLGCGSAREVPFCPSDYLNRVKQYCPDFEIEDHAFTVYGYCAKCRDV